MSWGRSSVWWNDRIWSLGCPFSINWFTGIKVCVITPWIMAIASIIHVQLNVLEMYQFHHTALNERQSPPTVSLFLVNRYSFYNSMLSWYANVHNIIELSTTYMFCSMELLTAIRAGDLVNQVVIFKSATGLLISAFTMGLILTIGSITVCNTNDIITKCLTGSSTIKVIGSFLRCYSNTPVYVKHVMKNPIEMQWMASSDNKCARYKHPDWD